MRKARVCNPYACTMSRNYTRNLQLEKSLRVTCIPDHFIFTVESVGMHSPAVLVAEALRILQGKCQRVKDLAEEHRDKMHE
jgi:DNA-directed RNA polymerase I and III subunit RPAC1